MTTSRTTVTRLHHLPAFLAIAMSVGLLNVSGAEAFQRTKKKDLTGNVTDSDGKAVSDARIVLIYKSWPNQRYRQQTFASRTNSEGHFVFKKLYPLKEQTEFLLTVVANGHAMYSEYFENPTGDKLVEFDFRLEQAIDKTFAFTNNGNPVSGAKIYPKSRVTENGDEYFIYPQSASKVMLKTDEAGKVKMNIFQKGDTVTLGLIQKGTESELKIDIDESEEQLVGGKKGKADLGGSIVDDKGQPITKAKVILLEKSWPNNQFQMDTFTAKPDTKGNFVFPRQYRVGDKAEFLISILADGYTMCSEYVSNTEGDELKPFKFALNPAIKKKFVLKDENGKPMSNAQVSPLSRTTSDGDDHMIYPVSSRYLKFKTDKNGQVELNFFAAGDEIKLAVTTAGNLTSFEFEVDSEQVQSVEVKKKVTDR